MISKYVVSTVKWWFLPVKNVYGNLFSKKKCALRFNSTDWLYFAVKSIWLICETHMSDFSTAIQWIGFFLFMRHVCHHVQFTYSIRHDHINHIIPRNAIRELRDQSNKYQDTKENLCALRSFYAKCGPLWFHPTYFASKLHYPNR